MIVDSELRAALVDVGGTLWPNSWPHREGDGEGRLARLRAAMPGLSPERAAALVHDIITSSRDLNGGTTMVTELIRVDANVVISDCLEHHGVPPEPASVAAVRRAMALPIDDRIHPLPGALELLVAIRSFGLRCVIASNTYWRDAGGYWEDFEMLGMAPYIDAIVTSVDAGHLKPHRAVFELAVRAAGVPAERCVVIGNKEANDIEPALAMGMRTILVHPDDPAPPASRAHAVAPDLWECARALEAMLGR
jgi:HAD superfamily hydrolase (TIGR01509 family)